MLPEPCKQTSQGEHICVHLGLAKGRRLRQRARGGGGGGGVDVGGMVGVSDMGGIGNTGIKFYTSALKISMMHCSPRLLSSMVIIRR